MCGLRCLLDMQVEMLRRQLDMSVWVEMTLGQRYSWELPSIKVTGLGEITQGGSGGRGQTSLEMRRGGW